MTCLPQGLPLSLAALAWLLFVLLACVGPGLALQRLLRLPIEPAIVLPLGLLWSAATYGLALGLALPWLFPLLTLALDASLLLGWRRPWRRAPGPSLRGALPALFALGLLLALTQFGLNRCAPDGGFLLDPLERVDTAFHVGVTFELTHAWPPQVPGLAGVPLRYHVAGHLVRAAATRFAGLHPYDLLTRFDLLFGLVALVLAWRALGQAVGAPAWVVAGLPWTLVLGDAAFALAPWAGDAWLAELTGANGLLVLFFGNTLVPALALAFGALVLLARLRTPAPEPALVPAWASERRRTLLLASVLVAGLAFLKLFVLPPLLAGLAWAGLRSRARRASVALLLSGLAALLYVLASGPALDTASLRWDPARLGVGLLALEGRATGAGGLEVAGAATLWLVLALGLRALGLVRAWRGLWAADPVRAGLALWALCGWPARAVLLTADGRFDESVYFSIQSGCVLWLFTLEVLHGAWHASARTRALRRAWVLAACLLALPTPVDFVRRRLATPAEHVPAALLRASARVAALSRPGELIVTPSFSRWPPAALVFIGRRVPYAEYLPYLSQFAPEATRATRLRDVRRFFRDEPLEDAAAPAAGTLVWIGGRLAPVEAGTSLERLYVDEDQRLYRVRSRATPRPPR